MVTSTRVLYADTDQMGLANHGAALRWFEQGRAEWLRNHGRSYRMVEEAGVYLPIYEMRARYRVPARYDDLLQIDAILRPPTYVRVIFDYVIRRAQDGVVLVEGETHHASIDESGRPKRLPEDLLLLLREHAVAPSAKE